MKFLKLMIAVMLTAVSGLLQAQSKDDKNYRKESVEIRQQVWAWEKPQFKLRTVPTIYANSSKVVIAHHTELTADSKSKFHLLITAGPKKEQTLTEVVREMVKLNDKKAVDDYSELSFTRFKKRSGFYNDSKTTIYIGVRILKPNGIVKEIDGDDIVLTKDETKEKKAKLAIPDLQPGDIIDYFIATVKFLTNDFSSKPYNLILFDDSPVLNLSFHGQLGKKFALEYRSYNGAPDLQVSKNNDEDIIVDFEKANIPPYETSFWVAPGLQLPFIRMNISLGYRGMGAKFMGASKPGEVAKNRSTDEVIDEKAGNLSTDYYNGYWMRGAKTKYETIESATKKKLKQLNIVFKDLSNEDKALQLYYTLRFTELLQFAIYKMSEMINIGNTSYNGLAFPLFCTMKAAQLQKPALLVGIQRGTYRLAEIMESEDLTTVAYLPDINKFFSLQTVYDLPFVAPAEMEGITDTKIFTFDHPAVVMSVNKMKGLSQIEDGVNVPVSSSDKNAHIENLKIDLNAEKTNLLVNRSTTMKGYYKADVQRQLILYEDFYESERKAFNDEKSLLDDMRGDKQRKKWVDEVVNAFAEARKKQKAAFISEAKDWFEQDITELTNYKTDTLGVRHTAPNFVYSSSFTLGGLVKKAGNNIIVDIGKVQGTPLTVMPEQRKRTLDVYMPFARSIEFNIELSIPEGYSAEGIAALNKLVRNETGYFTAEATVTGNKVLIKVKKHYLHNVEIAASWNKMLEFLDAANDWTNAKILFKKK